MVRCVGTGLLGEGGREGWWWWLRCVVVSLAGVWFVGFITATGKR